MPITRSSAPKTLTPGLKQKKRKKKALARSRANLTKRRKNYARL